MGKWTRRAFLGTGILAGGGLLIGVGAGIAVRPGHRTPKLANFMEDEGETLVNAWVKLLPDNSITVIVPHVEMGQGAHTVLPLMLADELDADWSTVTIEEAPAHEEYVTFHIVRDFIYPSPVPGIVEESLTGALMTISQKMALQITGGSFSVRATGERGMRVAGAALREMLITAAAEKWRVATTEIRTQNSYLYHDASQRSEPYASFAEAVAAQKTPQDPTLKTPDQYTLMGKQNVQRLDIPAKVNGTANFAIDADVPGMKYATLHTAPVFGGRIESLDTTAAESQKGVHKVVQLDDSFAVIADGYWSAKKAARHVHVVWAKTDTDAVNSDSIFAQFTKDMDAAIDKGKEKEDYASGDARTVLAAASNVIEAEYRVPYLAHAAMEPMNCTALVKDGNVEIWTGTQNPFGTRKAIAEALDIDLDNVAINNAYLGGGFGRRASPDYEIQAAKLANMMPGTPIKLIWSREQDVQHDHYRPAIMSRFKGALDAAGMPTAWDNQYVDKHEPVEAPDIPYNIANKFIHYTNSPTHVPFGPWRSVDHSQHAFFTESFIDELAVAAKQDPYAYRRKLLSTQPRHLHVLETVAEFAKWGKPLPEGWGQGIAIHASFGSIVAEVVDLDMSGGRPRIDKVFCAIDAGYAMSPDGLIAQMESGIIFGLTAALYGNVSIKDGRVQQSNFHDYQMVRMDSAPDIQVRIINSGEKVGGAGEPGTPPIAPALTNAIYAATGKRVRRLPIS